MRVLQLADNELSCLDSGRVALLSRRYSPLFLRLLFAHAKADKHLSAKILTAAIQQDYPSFTLYRNQVLRMLKDISQAFAALEVDVQVFPQTYRRSTGPWVLSNMDKVALLDDLRKAVPKSNIAIASRYVDWQACSGQRPKLLYDMLMDILTADIMAHEGYIKEAADYLLRCQRFPMKPYLRALIDLRRAKFLLSAGDFEEARALTLGIVAETKQRGDTNSLNLALYILARLDYAQAPALNYPMLLENMAKPQASAQADELSMMHWHNLRALLLRRQALDYPEKAWDCHHEALNHYEEAIFSAIRMDNADSTMDFMVNVAFHLQELLPLGVTKVADVFAWYHLAINYVDKMGGGEHSAWDRIFFTKLYLTYTPDILNSTLGKSILQTDMNPHQAPFYEQTLAKVRKSGDERQMVIFLLLYLQFSQKNADWQKVEQIKAQTLALLDAQTPFFTQALREEGYAKALDALFEDED